MNLNLKKKIILSVIISCILCTLISILIARNLIINNLVQALVNKSEIILNRAEAVETFIAKQNHLEEAISNSIKKYPSGELPNDEKIKILKFVPIIGAMDVSVSKTGSYTFQVISDNARNPKNIANPEEVKLLNEFRADKSFKQKVILNENENYLKVIRPVFLKQSEGCLLCHGDPATSPWKNGKDVLGYKLENMKDDDLKGAFLIKYPLDSVNIEAQNLTIKISLISGIIIFLSSIGGYILAIKITRPIAEASNILSSSTEEITSASLQLSSASQNLANGASRSASSIEEISASINELQRVNKENVNHLKDVTELASSVNEKATEGGHSMQNLLSCMEDIMNANNKVQNLVKVIEEIGDKTRVIDEIVFQTKLLSFNASVEAERAGEHGRGFSVVAQEVGNLAQMSGNAALEIANMVKKSMKSASEITTENRVKVEKGNSIALQTAKSLGEIIKAIELVGHKIEKIHISSEHQVTGMEQITIGVDRLDKDTQTNSATSEESAAAATQLEAQANELKQIVALLLQVVYGNNS